MRQIQKLSINEAIELINTEVEEDCFVGTPHRQKVHEAQRMAIRSLEAWEKVKADIYEELERLDEYESDDCEQISAYRYVLDCIKEHLREAREEQNGE